jgi:hypothetical protein
MKGIKEMTFEVISSFRCIHHWLMLEVDSAYEIPSCLAMRVGWRVQRIATFAAMCDNGSTLFWTHVTVVVGHHCIALWVND